MTLEDLLKNEPNETDPEKMGTVSSARLVRKDGTLKIVADGKKRYRWW